MFGRDLNVEWLKNTADQSKCERKVLVAGDDGAVDDVELLGPVVLPRDNLNRDLDRFVDQIGPLGRNSFTNIFRLVKVLGRAAEQLFGVKP